MDFPEGSNVKAPGGFKILLGPFFTTQKSLEGFYKIM